MATLQTKITELAEEFAQGVLAAVRSAPVEELMAGATPVRSSRPQSRTEASDAPTTPAPRKKNTGRLARRSQEQIEEVIVRIVQRLGEAPDGLRSEQLQRDLDLSKKEIAAPLAQAVDARQIKKTGQRRATTYFAPGGGGKVAAKAAAKSKKPNKKPAKKVKAAAPKKTSKAKAKSKVKTKPKAKAAPKTKAPKKTVKKVVKVVKVASKSNGALNSGAATAAPAE